MSFQSDSFTVRKRYNPADHVDASLTSEPQKLAEEVKKVESAIQDGIAAINKDFDEKFISRKRSLMSKICSFFSRKEEDTTIKEKRNELAQLEKLEKSVKSLKSDLEKQDLSAQKEKGRLSQSQSQSKNKEGEIQKINSRNLRKTSDISQKVLTKLNEYLEKDHSSIGTLNSISSQSTHLEKDKTIVADITSRKEALGRAIDSGRIANVRKQAGKEKLDSMGKQESLDDL